MDAHVRTMRAKHASFNDALTGSRLDVIKECVPLVHDVVETVLAALRRHLTIPDFIGVLLNQKLKIYQDQKIG